MKRKPWFGVMRSGGFGPVSWEGWAAIAGMVAMVAASLAYLRPLIVQWTGIHPAFAGLAMLPFWIAAFGAVVWLTHDREA